MGVALVGVICGRNTSHAGLPGVYLDMIGQQQTFFNKELLSSPDNNFAYLMGYLWSDGHLRKGNYNSISLEILKKDMDVIRPCIESTGIWTFRPPRSRPNRQECQCCFNGDKDFISFLRQNDFEIKKSVAPNKIVSFLGPKLLPYFLLGFLDGDGCLNFSKLKSGFYQSIALEFFSSYDQDWEWLSNICLNFGATCRINRRHRPSGNSSSLALNGKFAKIILDLMYSTNYPFCLYRKKIKYLSYNEYQLLPTKLRKKYISSFQV